MNTTEKEKFESLWKDFEALLRGKLINAANKQKLTTSLANLILREAALSWGSEYEINGKWLSKLKEMDSEKAELVNEVLLKDMKFDEIQRRSELPEYCSYVIPAVGACLGWGVSMALGCGKIIQTVSTIGSAILLYPAVAFFRKNQIETNKENNIALYMGQLDKFKNSIISILS